MSNVVFQQVRVFQIWVLAAGTGAGTNGMAPAKIMAPAQPYLVF